MIIFEILRDRKREIVFFKNVRAQKRSPRYSSFKKKSKNMGVFDGVNFKTDLDEILDESALEKISLPHSRVFLSEVFCANLTKNSIHLQSRLPPDHQRESNSPQGLRLRCTLISEFSSEIYSATKARINRALINACAIARFNWRFS